MKGIFNGEEISWTGEKRLTQLLEEYNYGKRLVVFLNGKKMLLRDIDSCLIQDGDTIKVFKPLSGG